MRIMVSACLLGENCKYNGGNNYNEKLATFLQGNEVIRVCPEVFGGLPTPRDKTEIVNGICMSEKGVNVNEQFHLGAKKTLDIAVENNIDMAILQSGSPSCGVKEIYDGTFSGTKIKGSGVTAKLLMKNGFKVVDIEDLDKKISIIH